MDIKEREQQRDYKRCIFFWHCLFCQCGLDCCVVKIRCLFVVGVVVGGVVVVVVVVVVVLSLSECSMPVFCDIDLTITCVFFGCLVLLF